MSPSAWNSTSPAKARPSNLHKQRGRLRSALSRLKLGRVGLIRDTAEFLPGRHGAMLSLGSCSGVLLPQLAANRHWTVEDFWNALARKSRLPPRAWRDPQARREIFEAQVFGRR
jgi:AMMECR1 domain-containing protein